MQGGKYSRDELCWQLHPEQLQLAPAAHDLVTALISIPREAEMRLPTILGLILPSQC